MDRVVRVERDAIQGVAVCIFGGTGRLDFNAIRVVRAHFVQSNDVRHHQAQQNQRHCNDVEAEEAVQSCIAHHEVAANEQSQIGANEGNGREQIDDHLSAPIGHLAPRQQVTHESFGHEAQEDGAAKNPDQFTWLAVAAIHEAAEHVQVHHNEESRSACGVHVANEPTPRHIAHDVFDRCKSKIGIWFVMHHQENTGDDLNHQHQQ